MNKLPRILFFLATAFALILLGAWIYISQNSIGKITEKEIQEFAQNDSLKLAAVNYLLENSADKYTRISIKKFSVKFPDKNFVSKRWFFKNIELAISEAEKRLQNQEFTKQQFFEYVLPYRLRFEITENWRSNPIEKLDTCFDEYVFTHASKINNSIRPNFAFKAVSKENRRFSHIYKNRYGSCNEMSDFAAFNMRANGIPVAVDFCKWANIVGGHQWNELILKNGSFPFMGMETNPTDSNQIGMITGVYKNPAKIYRKTFNKSEFTDEDFNPKKIINESNFIDVTKEYYPESQDVFIRLPDRSNHNHFFFLCVYNVNNWRPVAFTKAKSNLMVFRDVRPNNIFTLKKWNGKTLEYFQNPFTFDSLANIHFLKYVPENTTPVKLAFFNSPERELIRSFNVKGFEETQKIWQDILYENVTGRVENKTLYQLYYWNKKWVYVAESRAKNDSVYFTNAPKNAVYKIEIPGSKMNARIRCFTVDENNNQNWW
jgi:hypothetical protein